MRVELKVGIIKAAKTQRRVAAEIGRSEDRVSEIVLGLATPTDEERRALAQAVGRPVDELFPEFTHNK